MLGPHGGGDFGEITDIEWMDVLMQFVDGEKTGRTNEDLELERKHELNERERKSGVSVPRHCLDARCMVVLDA